MADRRSLVEGLKNTPPPIETTLEKDFVYGKVTKPTQLAEQPIATTPTATSNHARSPFSTRIRTDFAGALKRASLERQLAGESPNTLQDILEEAIEPWLKTHGYP